MMERTISIVVCTSGRPLELDRCLTSIAAGSRRPLEVVVSDDSPTEQAGAAVREICSRYDFARYSVGPGHGLCANRNGAVRLCRSDYISLLDDDAVLSPSFVDSALQIAASSDGRTLFTGDVLEDGITRVPPSNPTFLGHFGNHDISELRTIHLNCNLIPRAALEQAQFDEAIVYGYEDMDICEAIIAAGFRIKRVPEWCNVHLPPRRQSPASVVREHQAERARLYTSLKRYFLWQRRPVSGTLYLAIAPLHLFVSNVRREGATGIRPAMRDIAWAVRTFWARARTRMAPISGSGPFSRRPENSPPAKTGGTREGFRPHHEL